MLTIAEAFDKFKSRQELTNSEQDDVSRRHGDVRAVVKQGISVERDFLTGSYARWTKTRPLRDVDVFCVLDDDERDYRQRPPRVILEQIESLLVPIYGTDRVSIDRMAVQVDFGVLVDADDETDGKVMSVEVVPAFTKDDHYEIPDASHGHWIETNPEVHAQLAVNAHDAYKGEWKPLVRMIKKWNRNQGRPVSPSFLIEVMALDLLIPPFCGGYPYELKSFFAAAADRIYDNWADPAGLGPDVSDSMTMSQKSEARQALLDASEAATTAIRLSAQGKNGDALRAWRELFGPHFPLS